MTFEARLTVSVCSEALIGAFRTWLLWASPVTCAQALWCLTTRNPSASVSHKQASLDTVPTSTERNPTQNCFSYRHNPYAIHCHFHALLPEKHITTKDTNRACSAQKAGGTYRRFKYLTFSPFIQGVCPSSLAKLVQISPITFGFLEVVSIVSGITTQLITGGLPPCMEVSSNRGTSSHHPF